MIEAGNILPAILAGGLPVIAAFSWRVREAILRRDGYRCTDSGCECSRDDGWRIDASHFDHNRNSKHYDDIEGGSCQCLMCHARYHLAKNDVFGAFLIIKRAWYSGLHYNDWYFSQPDPTEAWENDRMALVGFLEENGLREQFDRFMQKNDNIE